MKVAAAAFAATVVLTAGSLFAQSPRTSTGEPQAASLRLPQRIGARLPQRHRPGPSAKYVAGLQPADFAVYEDGVKQDVRFFESNAVPVDLIVLIDTSSSMIDKMDDRARRRVRLPEDAAPGDRGAVVGFADSVASCSR